MHLGGCLSYPFIMVVLKKAAFLALGLSVTGHAFQPVIWADTNRDGVVDEKDIAGKEKWNFENGGNFMANVGDNNQRCLRLQGDKVADNRFNECNDATGDEQRNLKYMARLRIPPTLSPLPNCPVTARIELGGEGKQSDLAYNHVRIFRLKSGGDEKRAEDWVKLDPRSRDDHFTGEELRDEIHLGIDARDFAGHDGWDGFATLTLNTFCGTEYLNTDDVQLRVAPLLTHHCLQPLERVYVVAGDAVNPEVRGEQQSFADTIGKHISEAKTPMTFINDNNRWIQDWFESAYTSIPGKGGRPEVLRVFIRSARIRNPHDRRVFTEMRSDTAGAVQMSFPDDYSDGQKESLAGLEAMGNLETIPPTLWTE